jgi:hypothetical protein
MTIPISIIFTLFTLPPSSIPLNPLSTPPKAIARGEVHQPYTITLISFLHPPSPTSNPLPTHTVPILIIRTANIF